MWSWLFPSLRNSNHHSHTNDAHNRNIINREFLIPRFNIQRFDENVTIFPPTHPLSATFNPFLDISASYQGENQTQRQIFDHLFNFFEAYYHEHSINALSQESDVDFCKRKFIRTTRTFQSFNCIGGTGNQLAKLYQDALYAMITNRTITVPCHILGGECMIGMSLFTWIPLYDVVKHRYEKTCDHSFSGPLLAIESCGSLDIHHVIVDPASNHFHDASHFLIFNQYWDKNISYDKMIRINTLFQPTFYDNARFHAYGFIQMYMINFTRAVLSTAEAIWSNTLHTPNSIRISLHIRHFAVKENVEEKCRVIDHGFLIALKKVRDQYLNRTCVIYAATERASTAIRINQTASMINCTVYSIDRSNYSLLDTDIMTTGNKTASSVDILYRPVDHGEYGSGILPFADFLLLQKGDVLLGSGISTFSMMIANIVGLFALKRGVDHSPLYWDGSALPYYLDKKHERLCIPMNTSMNGKLEHRCHCLPKSYD